MPIVTLLFFYKDDFGIKWPTKVYIPLNNQTKQNQTKLNIHPRSIDKNTQTFPKR